MYHLKSYYFPKEELLHALHGHWKDVLVSFYFYLKEKLHVPCRRTRDVFNVAVSVHKNIQERDLVAGRNLGSTILHWLDRMKPSAHIRPQQQLPSSKPISSPPKVQKPSATYKALPDSSSNGKVLFAPLNIRSKILSSVPFTRIMRQGRLSAMNCNEFRRISVPTYCSVSRLGVEKKGLAEGIFRKDIAQWMMQA
jgi:hypothetical protein